MQNTITNKYHLWVESVMEDTPSLEIRKQKIEEINEAHFQELGVHLPAYLLEMLGTWLLAETYSDKRTNKVADEEFPVLSESQIVRRRRKLVHITEEATLEVLNYHLRNNSSTSKRNDEARKGEVDGTFEVYNN